MKLPVFSPGFEHITGEVNASFVSIFTMAASWLAPVPEAAMTGNAIITVFDLPPWLAFVVAASIEIAGFGVNSYYLEARAFNDAQEARQKRYNAKQTQLPLENVKGAKKMVVAFYVVTGCVVGLNAIYQVAVNGRPSIMLLAILFPVVSGLATVAANMRAALHRKLILANEPAEKVAESSPEHNEPVTELREPEPEPRPEPVQLNERQLQIAQWLQTHNDATYTAIGQAHEVSRTQATKDVERLQLAGVLRRNGNGWEVSQ